MRFKSMVIAAGLTALLGHPARAAEEVETDLKSGREVNALSEEETSKIVSQFETLRLDEKDFKLSPGWDLPMTIRSVENFFAKPLDIPTTASGWSDNIESADKLGDLYDVAMSILDGPRDAPLKKSRIIPPGMGVPAGLPPGLKRPVELLMGAIIQAQPYLNKAVDSVKPADRQGFLKLNEWPNAETGAVEQEISARRTKQQFDGMKTFSENDLYTAGQILIKAVDKALPLVPPDIELKTPLKWKTPAGLVVINGSGDEIYDKDDLKDVALLIDLGGDNTYKTPVATAHEKQIRLVIDFGENITVKADDDLHGNAGSGTFGIGMMICPNEDGVKHFATGSFAQGFGMAGIGVLSVNGPAHLDAERSVQGMGIFGVGIFSAKNGKGSTYTATRSGQGSALTRGVGLFTHQGDDADIRGGLVQPDPREPLGSVSMCQGVGFGPRAYTGGGVGLAVVTGNNISVKGSYFSQGVGYWHGFGVFRLRGDHNTLQARRYDMGSGVHSAFGHFDVFGDFNRILNWGVGPAYGWDHSIGSALVQGNDNEMQTEWGSGTASIGSLSFSRVQGNRNKMKLCDYGTNNFVNSEPAYSVHVIEGLENQLQCQGVADTGGKPLRRMRSPWGMFRMSGVTLADNLNLQPPEWPELPREEAVRREMVDLQAQIKAAAKKSPLEEVSDLVDVAAAFSLDKESPRRALRELVMLPLEKVPHLVEALDPAAIDQLIQLGVVLPSHGVTAANAMLKSIDQVPLRKKMVLISFLRSGRPSVICSPLLIISEKAAGDDVRAGALKTLAQLLNKDTGAEPGPRASLAALERTLDRPSDKKAKERAQALVKRTRFGDSFGLLMTAADLTPAQREEFFESAPDDITAELDDKGAKTFLKIMYGARKQNLALVREQLAVLDSVEPAVRKGLTELLISTHPAVVAAAVTGLGEIANPDDAAVIEPYLSNDATRVREMAAVALGRMGEAGIPILSRAMAAKEPRTRALAMVAVTQAVSAKSAGLLDQGFADSDALVRLTAVTALNNLPDCLRSDRDKLIIKAKKRLVQEEDPEVLLALNLLKPS